jgi:hypothetical protein
MYQSQCRPTVPGRRLVSQQQFVDQHRNSVTHRSSASSSFSFPYLHLLKHGAKLIALTLVAGSILALSGCGGLVYNGSAIATGSGSNSTAISLSAISCGTQSLTGAQSKACSVYLTGAATSATVVKLKSSSSALQVPSSVTVAKGAQSTGFNAVASTVSSSVSVTITGTAGVVAKTDVITLYPVQTPANSAALSKVSCGTTSLTGPTTKACSVYLSAAGASPVVVNLSSSNSALQVQPSVTVPAGSSTAGFGVTVLAVSASQSATLTASVGGASQSDVIELVGSGTQGSTQHKVQLNWDAPSSSSDPVVGYKVYRMTSGASTYTPLTASVDTQTSYTDTSVQSGVTYDYAVTSVGSNGVESSFSNSTVVTIP